MTFKSKSIASPRVYMQFIYNMIKNINIRSGRKHSASTYQYGQQYIYDLSAYCFAMGMRVLQLYWVKS